MSLRTTVSILESPTVTLSAGTATSYTNDGRGTNNANVLVDVTSSVAIALRKKITTRITPPAAAPNSAANAKLGRAQVTVHTPFVDTAGKTYLQPDSIEISFHPEATEAEILAKKLFLASILADTEFDNFFVKNIND